MKEGRNSVAKFWFTLSVVCLILALVTYPGGQQPTQVSVATNPIIAEPPREIAIPTVMQSPPPPAAEPAPSERDAQVETPEAPSSPQPEPPPSLAEPSTPSPATPTSSSSPVSTFLYLLHPNASLLHGGSFSEDACKSLFARSLPPRNAFLPLPCLLALFPLNSDWYEPPVPLIANMKYWIGSPSGLFYVRDLNGNVLDPLPENQGLWYTYPETHVAPDLRRIGAGGFKSSATSTYGQQQYLYFHYILNAVPCNDPSHQQIHTAATNWFFEQLDKIERR